MFIFEKHPPFPLVSEPEVPVSSKKSSSKASTKKPAKKKTLPQVVEADSDSSSDSEGEDVADASKGFLKQSHVELNSLDNAALQNLFEEFLKLPKILAKVPKNGGTVLRDHFNKLKNLISQIKAIRKATEKTKRNAEIRKSLKRTLAWFVDLFLENFGPDEESSGYVESLRMELKEMEARFLFGPVEIRRLRSKLKSFAEQNKSLKFMAPCQIYNWKVLKRSYSNPFDSNRAVVPYKKKPNNSAKKF